MIKHIFIDMDNCIAENTTCDNVPFSSGMYLNKRPIKTVINGIRYLYPNCTYHILSKTQDAAGRYEKIQWLQKYFPAINGFILIIDPEETKKEYIYTYMTKYQVNPEEILLIDDKKDILQDCKTLGIQVKYPQQIICDFETYIYK